MTYLQERYRVSERRACSTIRFPRASQRYRSHANDQAALRMRLKELAAARVRYGYRRLHVLLVREGWTVNVKRVYRLYRQGGLALRTQRPRQRLRCAPRIIRPTTGRLIERWSMDFVSDQLFNGRRFRALTIVDIFSRESLAIEVDFSINAEGVTAVLERLIAQRGKPRIVQVDNGTEFTSRVMDQWCYAKSIQLDFIRPGKPVENAHIESFNGRFRQECLNQHCFLSLAEARETIEAWRRDYNENRPYNSLGYQRPEEFRKPAGALPPRVYRFRNPRMSRKRKGRTNRPAIPYGPPPRRLGRSPAEPYPPGGYQRFYHEPSENSRSYWAKNGEQVTPMAIEKCCSRKKLKGTTYFRLLAKMGEDQGESKLSL